MDLGPNLRERGSKLSGCSSIKILVAKKSGFYPTLRFVNDLRGLAIGIACAAQFANHPIAPARGAELAAVENDL